MCDLLEVLPDFDQQKYRHLTFSLEKNQISVADLISLDSIEIAKRCPLPLSDLSAFVRDVIAALQNDIASKNLSRYDARVEPDHSRWEHIPRVRTLDATIDQCLGGGLPVGHITEIVGESAVGKTQFVLGLLLSVQLKPPLGLGRGAIYLSTEAPLNTARLHQMLSSNPAYTSLEADQQPNLDRIHTIATNNLESQDHIVRYQLPLAVERLDVGLIVMDSVAANFRAEHETRTAKGLADRAVDLLNLGTMLRDIAAKQNVAVVIANQVSDRFDEIRPPQDRFRSSSPAMASSPAMPEYTPRTHIMQSTDDVMTLDHQQRFFTGWGDQPATTSEQLKTPALGLSWANQLSARIVLKMESERVYQLSQNYQGGNIWKDRKKRRFVSVVFAPWVEQSIDPVEYEIQLQGATSVPKRAEGVHPHAELLDPKLWHDGAEDAEEEFP